MPNDKGAARILVVEDSLLIAEMIVDVLEGQGYAVVGPAARLADGMSLARRVELEGALLDVNLAGSFCFPIAATLDGRGIPFMFLTGYSDIALIPAEFRAVPRMSKPFSVAALGTAIAQMLQADKAGRPVSAGDAH